MCAFQSVTASARAAGRAAPSVRATAAKATVVALDANISGQVTAGTGLTAFAKTNISGTLTAGGDANVTAFGNLSGSVANSRNAYVTLGGNLTAAVNATTDAVVSANYRLTPQLAYREEIYQFPNPFRHALASDPVPEPWQGQISPPPQRFA